MRNWIGTQGNNLSTVKVFFGPPMVCAVGEFWGIGPIVTHKSKVARTVMCRQDGRGRFPVSLDDHSKCRINSQRKSQLS